MNKFLDWNDGNQESRAAGRDSRRPIASNAPYVWSADGKFLDRWPTNLGTVPAGSYNRRQRDGVSRWREPRAAIHALDCPLVRQHRRFRGQPSRTTARATSPPPPTSPFRLRHRVERFAPGGQLALLAPSTTTTPLPARSRCVQDPRRRRHSQRAHGRRRRSAADPGRSSDGSHILMAAGRSGPAESANCSIPPCGADVRDHDSLPDAARATSTCGSTTPSPTTSPRDTTSTTSA